MSLEDAGAVRSQCARQREIVSTGTEVGIAGERVRSAVRGRSEPAAERGGGVDAIGSIMFLVGSQMDKLRAVEGKQLDRGQVFDPAQN